MKLDENSKFKHTGDWLVATVSTLFIEFWIERALYTSDAGKSKPKQCLLTQMAESASRALALIAAMSALTPPTLRPCQRIMSSRRPISGDARPSASQMSFQNDVKHTCGCGPSVLSSPQPKKLENNEVTMNCRQPTVIQVPMTAANV